MGLGLNSDDSPETQQMATLGPDAAAGDAVLPPNWLVTLAMGVLLAMRGVETPCFAQILP
jgi:hypothetical protein